MALPKIVTLWQTHKKSRMVLVCPTASTRTSGRQPRPRRCPFAVIVITSESRASLSHLVRCGSLRAPSVPRRDFRCGTEAATWRRLCQGSDERSAPVPKRKRQSARCGRTRLLDLRGRRCDGTLVQDPSLLLLLATHESQIGVLWGTGSG